MSISTWGWGSFSISIGGWGGALEFLPWIYAKLEKYDPAYAWVLTRDYIDLITRDRNELITRITPTDLPGREWDILVERLKASLVVRSPGWPDEQ